MSEDGMSLNRIDNLGKIRSRMLEITHKGTKLYQLLFPLSLDNAKVQGRGQYDHD